MRDLTKNELMQRAIGGLRMLQTFVSNMDEEHISDSSCEEFEKNLKDLEAVEERLREEDEKITIHLPDGMLGAVKRDDEGE